MIHNIQESLLRTRPPRVKITYDKESNGAIEKQEIPFVIGILGEYSGHTQIREMMDINRSNFDDVMSILKPKIDLSAIPDVVTENASEAPLYLSAHLTFEQLNHFTPIQIVKRLPPLYTLYKLQMAIQKILEQATTFDSSNEIINALQSHGAATEHLHSQIAVAADNQALGTWLRNKLNDIVPRMNHQLNLIMHHQQFQALEASWLGLWYLVSCSNTDEMLKLHIFNISKNDLVQALVESSAPHQSTIYNLLLQTSNKKQDDQPYSLFVGDYIFNSSDIDQMLLSKLAEIAADAHAPFISGVDSCKPGRFSFENWEEPQRLERVFEGNELNIWRKFHQTENARFVTLTLPKTLMRLPYGSAFLPAEDIAFEENIDINDGTGLLWGNCAYILAERVTNAYALFGWPANILDQASGGCVENLPIYEYKSNDEQSKALGSLEKNISDNAQNALNDLGFMVICHCDKNKTATFIGGQKENNCSLQLLPNLLAATRFAGYLKAILRHHAHTLTTYDSIQAFLTDWISQYVMLVDNPSIEVQAAYPLRDARLEVMKVSDKLEKFKIKVCLQPQFQFPAQTDPIHLEFTFLR